MGVGAGHAKNTLFSCLHDTEPRPSRCRAAALSASNSDLSLADLMCSMLREPRRDNHTAYTAVAPELVFTVRTYATTAPYEPWLVSSSPKHSSSCRYHFPI
ncbi:hypothetical protein C8E89_14016 [Mycolicibacterium moriokaense]|uniref:Uncharacterized protein n=1 Tax=Mycolicibacterium moriokaense TaxID=39691 RepID=A0A318HHP3_9MYCO|nr:hypothetical protein C8E89_14016 [Mycolicibacterium moriokaense]